LSAIKNNGEFILNDANGHFYEQSKLPAYNAQCDIIDSAYEAAERYAKEHGIKIFNATRGGRLETFERVDFDDLFKNQEG
jgi:hypothetical protein